MLLLSKLTHERAEWRGSLGRARMARRAERID
jgi:hypothetical protein